MEEHALKVMAQLGLVALLVWIVAAAMGKREQAAVKTPRGPRKSDPKSNVWRQVPVQADQSSSGLLWTPGLMAYGG